MLETSKQYCPYCGESIRLLIDESMIGSEEFLDYIEDCEVCCRPIVIQLTIGDGGDGGLDVSLRTENE